MCIHVQGPVTLGECLLQQRRNLDVTLDRLQHGALVAAVLAGVTPFRMAGLSERVSRRGIRWSPCA